MRFFSLRFYKNMMGLSVCVLMIFAYGLFMEAIPDQIYVAAGETASYHFTVPVSVTLRGNDTEILSAMAESVNAVKSSTDSGKEMAVHYTVTCRLFGIFPAKDVQVTVVLPKRLHAGGEVIGIYGKANGVLVLDTAPVEAANGLRMEPAENKVRSGDYILSVNHEQIRHKEELVEKVNEYGKNTVVLGLVRKEEYIEVAVTPVFVGEDNYKLGVWVKDDMAGIGTMTYYAQDGSFGALGHGIGDGTTGALLRMEGGRLYEAKLTGIRKGERGNPGELEGVIYYQKDCYLGSIQENTNLGIYGTVDGEEWEVYAGEGGLEWYEVAYKQDVRTGHAEILSDISGTLERYSIEITGISYEEKSNKGIHFTVTDGRLISMTGGIVQGMSGSPILQNGKLIGAVTHVFVSDPQKGYGVFIENMLEH